MQTIPFIDIRNESPVSLVKQYPEKALNLVNASRSAFGLISRIASYVALPVGDILSRRWLERTNNLYLEEIDTYAKLLSIKGIYALNLCYEWGCTSSVYRNNDNTILMRVLDWPFPALGENIVVAHQNGEAGDFFNITWPGVSGIFQAVAVGRFAAALNQAPMRRYKSGIIIDWVRNRGRVNKHNGLPPAHLLRKVFEAASSYDDAKKILAEHPVSISVIYILSGTKTNEGCVIERLEDSVCIRELGTRDNVCAANHFETYLNGIGHGWLPRAEDSYGRAIGAYSMTNNDITEDFSWFKPPVANSLSRLAMTADAAKGTFSLIGTDGTKPVTEIFTL